MLRYKLIAKLIEPRLPVKTLKAESITYDCDKQTLLVGKYFDPNDYGFMRHLSQAHEYIEGVQYSYTLWALLHEIGHYMTEEKYGTNKELRAWFKEYSRLMIRDKHCQDRFYNCREEWEATEWAIAWVKAHPKKAKLFSLILR
jgi:hypothetical protein